MNPKKQILLYVLCDALFSLLAWIVFNIVRYYKWIVYENSFTSLFDYLTHDVMLLEYLLVPLGWMTLFFFSGYYNLPFRKSLLDEFLITLFSVLLGSLILFFAVILNDYLYWFALYYKLLFVLTGFTFFAVYIPRCCITMLTNYRIKQKKWKFKTLILGTGTRAQKLEENLSKIRRKLGYDVIGHIALQKEKTSVEGIRILGGEDQLDTIIKHESIDEIIIALDDSDPSYLFDLLNRLYQYNIPVQMSASRYEILIGGVKMSTIFGVPLVDVSRISTPEWQKNVKMVIDRLFAVIALVLFSPLLLYIACRIKKESDGPVFYQQERIGYHGRTFQIFKFRSMHTDAEREGPSLSSPSDSRITPFGRILRKYRLDELPQFWNVLKGDMSLVGPRPERPFFIRQIAQKAPYYYLVHRVKPGITSWGMVTYGYAETVDQMLERLDYDIIYLENLSIKLDLKILLYTIKTLLTGKGV